MKTYLVLFREPDGRVDSHSEEEMKGHGQNWKLWLDEWGKQGRLAGGNSLTLNGKLISGRDKIVTNTIHRSGTEIVGGFLLIKADNLEEATEIASSCPIYEFDGYAEVRELAN